MNAVPPPPMPTKDLGRTSSAFSPMVLSALVYPGAGQLMQRRWMAGLLVAGLFTVPAVWFFVEVFGVLKAYYDFAFNFSGATGKAPAAGSIILPFILSTLIYVGGLVDTAVAMNRQKTRRPS